MSGCEYVRKEMCKKKQFINGRKTIAWCQGTTLENIDGVKEMLKEHAVNKGYDIDDVMVEVTEFIDVFIFHLVEKEIDTKSGEAIYKLMHAGDKKEVTND